MNSTADLPDADTLNPACLTAANTCTLRAAIDQANADSADSTINLPPAPTRSPGPATTT